MMDSVAIFIQKTKQEEIPKLVAKGYPEPMTAFYHDKLEMVGNSLKESKALYAFEVLEPDETNPEEKNKVEEALKKNESQLQALDQCKKTFDSQYGSDLRKLVQGST
eukprot:7842448-Alexandrium_andersonii.AAC.1